MIRAVVAAILLAVLVGSCSSGPQELVLMTHSSFVMSEAAVEAFETANNIDLVLRPAGDAGSMVNQAVLTKDNPVADVLFGIDNTFLSRALEEELFAAYESPLLSTVPAELVLDPEHRVTPMDFGDVCLNFDRTAFIEAGVTVPASLLELTDPTYRSRLVVEDPATSSPGLAFLLATIAEFGETGDYTWEDYWRDLVANDVLAVAGWEEAYYNEFSGASDGTRPLVVSYASSPPAEVIFGGENVVQAPTGVIPATCFRQIEFAGIVAGTELPVESQALIDFLLSREFQEEVPLSMFVFPANREAALPQEFIDHTTVPVNPATIAPDLIAANREKWIEAWTDIVR